MHCAFYSLALFYSGAVSEVVPVTKASTVHTKSPRRDGSASKASAVPQNSPRRDGPSSKASAVHQNSPRRDGPASKAPTVQSKSPERSGVPHATKTWAAAWQTANTSRRVGFLQQGPFQTPDLFKTLQSKPVVIFACYAIVILIFFFSLVHGRYLKEIARQVRALRMEQKRQRLRADAGEVPVFTAEYETPLKTASAFFYFEAKLSENSDVRQNLVS